MIDWYYLFLFAIAFLWLTSTKRDEAALLIVLVATLCSELAVDGITRHIDGAWKLVVPGAIETATIICLLKWARNRTGFLQAGCLMVAWLAHVLCYFDVVTGTNIVYSAYEVILGIVALAQIAVCHDTLAHNFRRLVFWIGGIVQARRLGGIHPTSVCDPVLRDSRLPKL